jgi:hypothetical protein
MKFDLTHCSSFLKPEFKEVDIKNGIPRNFLIDSYADFLVVIQKYFTCEGRFNLAFLYHFKLSMHFIGKEAINIPFFLFRSIGKMSDKVQAKTTTSSPALFHSSLIKLLVLEELSKIGNTWESFLTSNHYEMTSPSPKRPTPKIKRPTSQTIAASIPISPLAQNLISTHIPQPVLKTPEVTLKTSPSMSRGNRKEKKIYLRKRSKLKAIQEELEEINKERTPPLDHSLEIVVIESAERPQEQVRQAKGKCKRLMFQEIRKQTLQPKRPRTSLELKMMAEQAQASPEPPKTDQAQASPKPPKIDETQQEVFPPTYSIQEREFPHEKELVKLRDLKRLLKQARMEVVTVRQQNRYLSESWAKHLQIRATAM